MRRPLLLLALLVPFVVGSCDRRETIVVGAKAFTEGYLLGHMAVILLEEAGYEVDEQFGLATSAMRGALESGQVDLYAEYTGTAYAVYDGGNDQEVMVDSARLLAAVRRSDSARGLRWLRPLPFNNTYALLMRRDSGSTREIRTMSDLAAAMREGREMRVAVDAEFYGRADGWKALAERYRMPERGIVKMDAGLIYDALRSGQVEVGMGYSTDGRIAAWGLRELEDDRSFFPRYNPAFVIRSETLGRRPGIPEALAPLATMLDTETMRRLNASVDIEHRDPRNVAEEFLSRHLRRRYSDCRCSHRSSYR